MKLYHGTNMDFMQVELEKSRPNKDFGKGFYLSDNRLQAEEMASHKCLQEGGTPIIQAYYFDEANLTSDILNTLRFNNYSEEWSGLY